MSSALNGTGVTFNDGGTLNNNGVGQIAFYAMNTAPSGWLKANGAIVSRSTYSLLFSTIGTTYGAGDGFSTFQLPDMRGYFLRAWDDGRGVDTGRTFASFQDSANLAHSHGQGFITNGSGGGFSPAGVGDSGETSTTSSGGTEARPKNFSLLACIKF